MLASLFAGVLLLAQFGQTPQEIASTAGRVGIDVTRAGGNIVVSAVTPGSSAEAIGLKVGDQVLRIDVDNTQAKSQSAASAALRGVYLSSVTLTVLPRGSMLPRTIDVKRDVRLYDVAHSATADSSDFAERKPEIASSAKPVITAKVTDFQKTGGAVSEEKLRAAFDRSPSDVATCIGALDEVLPNGLDRIGATFTFKKEGSVAVRTDPPSGDLSSCLGRSAARWKVPKAGKEPTVVQIFWQITSTR